MDAPSPHHGAAAGAAIGPAIGAAIGEAARVSSRAHMALGCCTKYVWPLAMTLSGIRPMVMLPLPNVYVRPALCVKRSRSISLRTFRRESERERERERESERGEGCEALMRSPGGHTCAQASVRRSGVSR